jgi:hypothetical protein
VHEAEAARRRRIERRARVLTVVGATATVALPALSVLVLAGPGGWTPGLAAVAGVVVVLGCTGWWIDAVREWWQLDWWVHRFRSVVAWLLPLFNLFAIAQESRILLDRAAAPRSVGRLFYVGFVVTVVLSWFRQTWAEVASTGLIGLLPLALVLLTMRSLRQEWRRRDGATREPRNSGAVELG